MIIGLGTETRGDDAAGLLVARRLQELGVAALEYSGELLGLMDLWEGAERVILIDALRSGRPPGTIMVLDARQAPFTGDAMPISTHGLGLYETLSLAEELGRLPPHVVIYGIEAHHLEAAGEVSAEVLAAVEEVAERIAREVAECTNPA